MHLIKISNNKIAINNNGNYIFVCTKADFGAEDMCRANCESRMPPLKTKDKHRRGVQLNIATQYYNCAAIAYECRPLTLEEVGVCLGMTRERVRQVEGLAMRKLRYLFKQKAKKEGLNDVRKLFTR